VTAVKVKQRRRHGRARKPAPVTFPELETVYANRFNAAWRVAVGSIIEAGRILAEAKEALPGRFVGFVQSRLGMHPTTAQRLMAIAADAWITDAAHVLHLPPSWGTLYQISTLSVPDRERLLEAGIIRADMERADIENAIRELRGPASPKPKRKTSTPVIEPPAPPKPSTEVMFAAMARNAQAEAEVLAAEETEAQALCCSFCGEIGLDLVRKRNAAHSATICWPCAAEAVALLARPSLPEVEAIADAMRAHAAPEEPVAPAAPDQHVATRRQGDEAGDRHNGGDARQ
jgi:hypothetical protein